MEIKFWNQPKDLKLGEVLNEKLKKGFQKVWIIAGVAKDTGIEMLIESLEEARSLETEINIYIGTDRKNISKDMLQKLINCGCNLHLHINRDDNKVETRMYIFESDEKDSYIYTTSGKLSEGGLYTSHLIFQETTYTNAERKLFENAKKTIINGCDSFKLSGMEELKLLAEKGEIAARITERKIPSISEMYGNSSIEIIGSDLYDENSTSHLFNIPENDIDIDIDIDIDGEVKKTELSVETAAKKEKVEKENLEKIATKKLSKYYENETNQVTDKKVSIIKDANNIDFTNHNIFICELNKIVEKGLGEGEIKIPIYLYEEMKGFFGTELFHTLVDEKNKERFGIEAKFEIVDVLNGEKHCDENALIYVEEKYVALKSKLFKQVGMEEKDIIRIIKNADKEYSIEWISKNIKEYEVWENVCVYTMKNTKRKFGIM